MEGILSESGMKYVCIGICLVAFITGTVLLILGFSTLEATEYGLDYSWISKTISPDVKTNGLYFLGIGHSFIKFPKNVQTIEFSNEKNSNRKPIESRTHDGLEVTIEISFQFALQQDKLYQLYNLFGKDYVMALQNIAVDVLTDEATKYNAYDFFMDRGRIKDDFQVSLDKKFNEICSSSIQFLQLRSVDLPNLFEESIQESEVKKQDIMKAQAELNKVKVEVETKILAAKFQQDVAVNIAKGEAGAILQDNDAQVKSLKTVQKAKSDGYVNLKTALSMDNKTLLNFIKSKLIKSYEGKDIALNIQTPELEQK